MCIVHEVKYTNETPDSYKIPILLPLVPLARDIHNYISQIDSNKFYSNFGPLERELRDRFASIWGVPTAHVRTACNATLALQGAIETSEPNSYSWESPSWTFAATALALEKAGVEYDFVDIDLEEWRADFSKNVKNVVDVLPFGDTLDLERYNNFEIENLVIDGAASVGSLLTPLPTTNKPFALIISLHATKLLPAGEGAIFVSNCRSWSERFGSWTNFGFDQNRRVEILGTNAKLSEYGAAVAHAALDCFPKTISKIIFSQTSANTISKSIGIKVHPAMRKGMPSPYWIIELDSPMEKNKFKSYLEFSGIQTRDWWGAGCHENSIFKTEKKVLLNTTLLASRTLGLPMHAFLTNADFSYIEEKLTKLKQSTNR